MMEDPKPQSAGWGLHDRARQGGAFLVIVAAGFSCYRAITNDSVWLQESAIYILGLPVGLALFRGQSAEFENWVLAERSSLASMVEVVLLQQASQLFDSGNYLAAADTAERAWEIAIRDGFPSPDYVVLYHRILASGARPSARSVRVVAEEFSIDLRPVEPVTFTSRTLARPRN